jgi:hypothetical protein
VAGPDKGATVGDILVSPAGAVAPAPAESWDDPPAFLASAAVRAATACRAVAALAGSSGDPKACRAAVVVEVAALVQGVSAVAPGPRILAGLRFAATSARRRTA